MCWTSTSVTELCISLRNLLILCERRSVVGSFWTSDSSGSLGAQTTSCSEPSVTARHLIINKKEELSSVTLGSGISFANRAERVKFHVLAATFRK